MVKCWVFFPILFFNISFSFCGCKNQKWTGGMCVRFPGAAHFQCAWASAYKTRVAPALPKHYNKAHAPGKSSSSLSGSWIACLIIEVIEERVHCIINSHSFVIFLCCTLQFINKMRTFFALFSLLLVVLCVQCAPQTREGAAYTNEAIRQAQQTLLIPKDAQIQNVQEGIELGAYEQIPGNQRINLFDILGDTVPSEVINNLQSQVDQIGRN